MILDNSLEMHCIVFSAGASIHFSDGGGGTSKKNVKILVVVLGKI